VKNSSHVCCSFSSSSDGNGYMAGNFSESDEDYVNSTVLEAGNLFTQICLCENEKRSRITIRAKVQSIYKRYGPHRPHDHMGQK